MVNIIKFNLLKLKQEYNIFIIMIVLSLGLSFAFNLGFNQEYKPTVYLINETASEEIIEDFLADENYTFVLASRDESENRLLNNMIFAAVILKTDSIEILSVKKDVEVLSLENYLKEKYRTIHNKIMIVETIEDNLRISDKKGLKARVEDSFNYRKVLSLDKILFDRSNKVSYNHNFFGFSIYFVTFTLVFGIANILEEKENHTWDRLMILPMKREKIVLGNMAVTVIMGVIQLLIILIVGNFLFELNLAGKWFTMWVLLLVYIFTITSMGLLLSTIVDTHAQLSAISPVLLTSTAMIGGCMWPLEVVSSKVMLLLSNFVPQKWVIQAVKKIIVYNEGIIDISYELGVVFLFGLIFYSIGMYRLRKESL